MSSSFISNIRSQFPTVRSSLSVSDAVELISIMHDNHSQTDIKVLTDFAIFVEDMSSMIEGNDPWEFKMRESSSALALVTNIVKQDYNDDMRVSAFTSVLALSLAINNASTLEYFLMNSREITDHVSLPFVLNDVSKSLMRCYMSGVMTFWLSYDQLDIIKGPNSPVLTALNNASFKLSLVNMPLLMWIREVIIIKFEKEKKTKIVGNGVTVTYSYANGVDIVERKTIETTGLLNTA